MRRFQRKTVLKTKQKGGGGGGGGGVLAQDFTYMEHERFQKKNGLKNG